MKTSTKTSNLIIRNIDSKGTERIVADVSIEEKSGITYLLIQCKLSFVCNHVIIHRTERLLIFHNDSKTWVYELK